MRSAFTLLIAFGVIASAETTYTRDVARIIQAKCQQCHRPNDVAPFALMTYDDAVTYSEDIKQSLKNKTCLLYTSPSPRDRQKSRMPSSA